MEKNGLGRAYIAGFKWALERNYDFVFELDGDFSHNPDDIPMFLEAARNADLVLGSRYLNGIRIINWPLSRLMLSKSAAKYVQVITGMKITDPTGGYKCFTRRALQAINLQEINSNGYSFQIEMTHRLWRQGMRIVEVPIVFTERVQGHSKMSGNIISEALIMVWRLWFQNGMRRRPAVPPANPPAPTATNQSPSFHRAGAPNTCIVSSANRRRVSTENALSGWRPEAAIESGGAGAIGSEAGPAL